MGALADLLEQAAAGPPLVAVQAVVGPRFTGVAGGPADAPRPTAGGVAYTDAGELQPGFDTAAATRALQAQVRGRPLADLARGLIRAAPDDDGRPAAGLDLAAASLNALLGARLRARDTALGDENGLDLIARLSAGKRLAVVGRFPYLEDIRLPARESWVLELRPAGDELPAAAAPEVIPRADVVGITGSTLANGTLEGLLALCRRDAFVAIIGPTTPLSPVLFDYGASILCGAIADDPQRMLEGVAAGGSTRRLPGMRQVSLRP